MSSNRVHHHNLFLALGILTVNALALYGIYRAGTVIYTFELTHNTFERVVILGFFLAELFIMLNATGYFINILASTFFYEREALSFKNMKDWPKVTAFIAMRNEPVHLVSKTFVACKYMDYPNFEIVAIDSSDEEYAEPIKAAAKELGITYFKTPFPRHGAKAGAMNEALKVFKTRYFAVFDADYRPSRDFLKLLVPQMEADETLAYIQTPQFYGNHVDSPVSRISQIQQSIFYEYISEGKSVHNSMFLCGTNFIMRRKAIKSVGGWDEKSITEDYATSMHIVKKGWKTKYFNYTTAFGEGPINLEEYFKQQYRWSRGTFGSFFNNVLHILNPFNQLSFWQRVEFTLSGMYFGVGFVWMILILMPIFYIFFRVPAYSSDPLLFSIIYTPYLISSFLFYALTMKYRYFRLSDLIKAQSLTLITLPIYVKSLFHALIGRRAVFHTTKKEGNAFEIKPRTIWIQMTLIVLNVLAVFYGLWNFPDAGNKPALLSNIVWATFHAAILLYFIVTLYVAQQRNAHA